MDVLIAALYAYALYVFLFPVCCFLFDKEGWATDNRHWLWSRRQHCRFSWPPTFLIFPYFLIIRRVQSWVRSGDTTAKYLAFRNSFIFLVVQGTLTIAFYYA